MDRGAASEIYLKDAINRDLLVPFKYYGLYDATDYSGIRYANGKYDIDELERELSRQERADLILEKYSQLAGSKTLAFCASINHADYMSEFFNVHGVRAAAVHTSPCSILSATINAPTTSRRCWPGTIPSIPV